MDSFVEQLVTKKKTKAQIAVIVMIIIAAALLFGASIWLLRYFKLIAAAAMVAICYGAWHLITSQNIEYEYCVTNGDMDIDRIIAQRKRERLVSVSGRKIESAGRYYADRWVGCAVDRTVVAAPSLEEENLYYFTYRSKKRGHTLVVFQPDERVKQAVLESLPKLVQMDWEKSEQ